MFKVREKDKILKGMTFIDLFSGIGGFHLALSSYGCKCVFASEINKEACEVYQRNFRIRPHGDIRKIKAKSIPSHDILCAGFPCQAFSISGNQNGFSDENGKLFFEILRIAKYHKPKMILLENVKNFVVHDEGKTMALIEDRLKKIGYTTYKKVLCATDFSIPQARYRVYIIAFRNDFKVNTFDFPVRKGKLKSVSDILEENADDSYYITTQYTINTQLDLNLQKSNKLVRVGSVGLGRQGERIYSVKGQGVTLSSQGGGIGGKTGMYLINDRVRKLTPRECARMMGFPETFKIALTDAECYKQFGNSIVVNVLQEVISAASKNIVQGDNNEQY